LCLFWTDLRVPVMAPLGPWQLLQNIYPFEQVLVLDRVRLEYMRPSLATLLPLSPFFSCAHSTDRPFPLFQLFLSLFSSLQF
jgi:hypothetical protein